MIISLCGKGGCGKSTVSSLLAKEFAQEGSSVLVVDSDASNIGINRQLGLPMPKDFINYFGGKRAVHDSIMRSDLEPTLIEQTWTFSDIPAEYISEKNGIKFLTIGKIRGSGEGCTCPMDAITKQIINNLRLNPGDVLIMDTEAGIEHLGKDIEIGVDSILIIVEPSYESIMLSKTILEISSKKHKPAYFILNKVDSASDDYLRNLIGNYGKIIASIPTSDSIAFKGLVGEELVFDNDEIKKLARFLKNKIS